ncbi:MAG: hypothetical protein JNG85_00480 [Spirochaetaceae bacterium]|nr:hypothetical protein [Spirochaetaceae bacterium]
MPAILLSLVLATACPPSLDPVRTVEMVGPAGAPGRRWTMLYHLCGDNDLESAALVDFNELEAAPQSPDAVSLVLVDRGPGYDASDGDWTDTRLYLVESDEGGLNGRLVSTRLASPELGLSPTEASELDMASPETLARFIDFARREYPAERYALVLWGHGTGWRSARIGALENADGLWKGSIADDASKGILHTAALGKALRGKDLDVIGLDLCFGALMEIAYELRDCADYLVASEGPTPSCGWDYRDALGRFHEGADRGPGALAGAFVDSYAGQYATQPGACVSALRLSRIGDAALALDAFCSRLASSIETSFQRDLAKDALLEDAEDFYFPVFPSDLFVDLKDAALSIKTALPGLVDGEAALLASAVDTAVALSWTSGTGSPRATGLALHVAPIDQNGNVMARHDPAYFKNGVVDDPLAFVRDSAWVPSIPAGGGLLDVLWYKRF